MKLLYTIDLLFIVFFYGNLSAMQGDQKELNLHLLYATEKDDLKQMQSLFDKKAQVNIVTNHCLPTVVAVSRRSIKCLELLISNKADINLEGCPSQYLISPYMTPLALAVCMGEKEIVEFLCQAGSNLCVRGKGFSNIRALQEYPGRGALEWGIVYFKEECITMLLEAAKKSDEERCNEISCINYFTALKAGEYKEYVRNFLTFFLILKKNKQGPLYGLPKPLFLEIIKKSLNPYCTLYAMITNESAIVEQVDSDPFSYPITTSMTYNTTPYKLAEKIFLQEKNNQEAGSIKQLLDTYLGIATKNMEVFSLFKQKNKIMDCNVCVIQ